MRVLVTGGAGFIGSHFIRRLLLENYDVICVDNFNDFYSPKVKELNIQPFSKKKNFTLYRGDITDYGLMEKIFNKENIHQVVHMAARAGIRPSIQNPFIYQKVNVEGTLNMLELSRKKKVSKFILISSSSVYGNNSKIPFSENDPISEPISPYAATKRSAELLTYTYHHLYALNTVIIRPFTVYGPSGRPDMAPFIFTKLIDSGKKIQRFGDGSTKRDYTYIDDFTDGTIAALEKDLKFEIFNLGNSRAIKLNKLITTIESALGKKAMIEELPYQPGDMSLTYADISKAKKLLNYNPQITLKDGITRFVSWYKEYKKFY